MRLGITILFCLLSVGCASTPKVRDARPGDFPDAEIKLCPSCKFYWWEKNTREPKPPPPPSNTTYWT